MKVYVARRHYDYEGFSIIGIFTDHESAQKCCDSDEQWGDSHDVDEHELQESFEGK
jgi:hypothetical protein